MTICGMIPYCGAGQPLTALNIIGQSVDGIGSKFKLKNITTGLYHAFSIFAGSNQYYLQIGQFNPVLIGGNTYALEYDGREYFRTVVQCPIGLSGVYQMRQAQQVTRDFYNSNIVKKIPNPTIRTALIGE